MMFPQSRHSGSSHLPQQLKFTTSDSCDRIKDEFQLLQAQYHRYVSGNRLQKPPRASRGGPLCTRSWDRPLWHRFPARSGTRHGPSVAKRWAPCSRTLCPPFPAWISPRAQLSQAAIASVSHLGDRRQRPGGRPGAHPPLPSFGRGPGGAPAVQFGPALAKSCNSGRGTLCPPPKDGILEGENALPSAPTPSQVFPRCRAQPALCTALPALPCAALPALPPLAGSFPPLSLLAAILGSRMLQGALKAKCFRFSACGMASADPKAGC
ncbi:uncharacterized protein LOC104915869 isoform X1 [Meleagris gallopavo]|uniref:Groucho/TLE N-terminal Q-rich domain-containing protein n=1 Tax=Meleagris gallopavo TaxID=9103 RepID=A0A803YQ47_MELGA|nr:uncharacterized protein LOC104915869 isoform X1 [Meleagris gallopavo]